jgi:hypothetical protein
VIDRLSCQLKTDPGHRDVQNAPTFIDAAKSRRLVHVGSPVVASTPRFIRTETLFGFLHLSSAAVVGRTAQRFGWVTSGEGGWWVVEEGVRRCFFFLGSIPRAKGRRVDQGGNRCRWDVGRFFFFPKFVFFFLRSTIPSQGATTKFGAAAALIRRLDRLGGRTKGKKKE